MGYTSTTAAVERVLAGGKPCAQVIKKELVTDDEDIDWVQTEKHVFETASNHPFLVGLHSCFQTSSRYTLLLSTSLTLASQTVLRYRVRARGRPHVPHAEAAEAARGTRQVTTFLAIISFNAIFQVLQL